MLKTQPIPMPKPKTHHLAMALAVAVATQLVATTTAIRVGFGVTTGCSIPFRKMGLALGFLGARCSVLFARFYAFQDPLPSGHYGYCKMSAAFVH